MTGIFQDLAPMLEEGKKAYDETYTKDLPLASAAVDGNVTFVCDWVKEDLPLDNKEGTTLDWVVRQVIAGTCDSVAPELKNPPEPEKWDVLVFPDRAGLCKKILAKVPETRLGKTKVVKQSQLTADGCAELLANDSWDLVIFGCHLDPPKSGSAVDVISQQTQADKVCFHLLQTIMKNEGCCKRLAVLTHGIFSEQEDHCRERGLSMVAGSTMYGMMNTARIELDIPIQLIDLEMVDSSELIPDLVTELFRSQTFGMNTVRLCWPYPKRNRIRVNKPYGRYVYRMMRSQKYEEAADKDWEMPEEGIIAISGGNGALGLVFGRWFLDKAAKQQAMTGGQYKPKFSIQFLSRSAKVTDQNAYLWEQVQEKAAKLGVSVMQGKVDMSSQEAVDNFVRSVSPNLIGFVHSAGVLQDGMLFGQTWEKFETVYDSKHRSALYLHDSLERIQNPDFQFFWLFSSTAVYGNMGQINYSASNSCLDSLARYRFARGLPGVSMHWGAWGEVGMAAGLDDASRARFAAGPLPYFSVAQGIAGLEGGLRTGLPEFQTFIINPPALLKMLSDDSKAGVRHDCNFYSQMLPCAMPTIFDRSHTYDIYRMYRCILAPYVPEDDTQNECIWWKKFMMPADHPKKEEENIVEIMEVDFI